MAIDVRKVLEVVPRIRSTPANGAPAWIAGVFVYRGRAVPVVDLHRLMGVGDCPPHLSSRIVLVRDPAGGPESLVGLLATKVAEIREIDPGLARLLPSQADRPGLGSMLPDGSGLLRLLDPDELLGQLSSGSSESTTELSRASIG